MMHITGVKSCKTQTKLRIGMSIDNDDFFIVLAGKKPLHISKEILVIRFTEKNIVMSVSNDFTLSDKTISGIASKYTENILETKLILIYESFVKPWIKDDMVLESLFRNIIAKLSDRLNSHIGSDCKLTTNRQYVINMLKESTITFS